MTLPEPVRPYFIGALDLSEQVYDELVAGFAADDAFWDFRPYPERFTMREALAHVADWNDIYYERIERTRNEDNPQLPDIDEGALAVERDYASANPSETLDRFKSTRRRLADMIKAIPAGEWGRTAYRDKIGDLTISDLIALISVHDAYHLRQAFDYREKFKTNAMPT